jgi:voltage-gated potassium channel
MFYCFPGMQDNLKRERNKLLKSIENLLEVPMVFLGFIWLILLIIELIWQLSPILEFLSLFIWGLFIIDFLIKFFLAPGKAQFIKSNWLTAISLLIPAIRILRVFKMARVLRGLRGIRLLRIVSSLNRGMKSLGATMRRRGFGYVVILTLVICFAGAAGMYGFEKGNPGFGSFGLALWFTAMRIITAGSDFYPLTPEGRALTFILAVYGYAVFGYVTATLATFFIGRDAEEKNAPLAGARDLDLIYQQLSKLTSQIEKLRMQRGK